mmetsp:Transcript_24337/g.79422  ORF Transcript_24337/g.79422 Transcript_24337/m.79422 type:complete len:156 (+) Transcript_24337:31-498(+)
MAARLSGVLTRPARSSQATGSLPRRTRQPRGLAVVRRAVESSRKEGQGEAAEAGLEVPEKEVASTSGGSAAAAEAEAALEAKLAKLKAQQAEAEAAKELGWFEGAQEEAGNVQWPTFPVVLQNTAIVIAGVVGSALVLTAINAVLSTVAEKAFPS